MINFMLGLISGVGVVVVVGLFYFLSFYKEKKYNGAHKFLSLPILNKEELKDGKYYLLVVKIMQDELFTFTAKWDKRIGAFVSSGHYYKYEDVVAVLEETSKPIITDYNPNEINSLDIEELNKICFELSDENVESDEIWEKLIDYFDKRGLSK